MYTVNSGIELDTINDLIYHLNNIVSEYGDLPIYIEDNSPGVEDRIPIRCIIIKSSAEGSLTLLVN